MVKISPSILSCDFSILKDEIIAITDAGCDYIHIDVMDGHFVPNLTFGAGVISKIRNHTTKIFDVHLMMDEPIRYIDDYVKAGSDIITIHTESPEVIKLGIRNSIEIIKNKGVKVGLSIKPNTPVETITEYLPLLDLVLVMSVEPGFGGQSFMMESLTKISFLKEIANKNGYHYEIEVDGGINEETANLCKEAGADCLVAGSYVFNQDYKTAIESLR